MMPKIAEEQIQKAIRLYKNKDLQITEISNLTGISLSKLTQVYKECFENGTLKPRAEKIALKHRPAKGEGRPPYVKVEKGESFCEQVFGKKFSQLSPEEKKEFLKLQKRLSRNGTIKRNPKKTAEEKREYHRMYYHAHKEQKKTTNRRYYEKTIGRKAFDWTLSVKLFGKRWKDLSPEERKNYNRIKQIIYLERKKGAEMTWNG